ncbi:hypothetical protein ACS0TY_018800 [Phlomoides rotata]
MATISSKLLQTLSLFLMLANQLVHSQDVTSFAFDTFSQNALGLTYQGGAHVPQGSTFLRLTETDSSGLPKSWTAGRVVYSRPVRFWERSPARQATFETTINFLITPSQNGAADGLAFFIAPVNTTIPSGATGANLGIFGSSGTTSSLFAVEFDNYVNGWDPSYRHIGIDIESRTSRNTTNFDSATGQLVNARINYNSNTKTITVVATSGSQTASLSYVFDLKTILPEQVQVGISSATGQTVSALGVHDVISWYFTSSLVYTNVNNDEKAYIRKYMGMY